MRAGTCTPSLAGMLTISGLIHGPRRNSSVVLVVSFVRLASASVATNSSGGVFDVEKTSAMRAPSGLTVT